MNTRAKGARRPLQGAVALVLALGSNAAMALGLGDIRVLSQPGQPLLAEIPVVSADPGELEAARVALASPATFARVGLERPSGLVSQLQFAFATDAQGRSVIRVSSPGPVDMPVVSFLIEVDWGRGRLVREYSALVDRPHTATAIEAPQIQAPSMAPSNVIVREPAAPVPLAPAPAPAPAPAAAAAAPAPVAPPAAAPARPAPALPDAGQALTVQAGQTLSQLAVGVARNNNVSLDQAMIALLQANPQAFIGGNIHRLRSGAQLSLPDAQALSSLGAAQARAMVGEQTGQWRQARAALPQPAVAQASDAAAPAAPPAPAAAAAAAAAAGARLEIAPTVAVDGTAQASESGTVAGAEGDMLVSEQLRQAREDLATRDAEINELRERVAELEKLREQQSALIALKDNEMATAQQQVATRTNPSESGGMWLWGGGLLLVGAAVAAWLARRRKPSPLPPLAATAGEPAFGDDAPGAAAALDADAMIQALRGEPGLQVEDDLVAGHRAANPAGADAGLAGADEAWTAAEAVAGEPVLPAAADPWFPADPAHPVEGVTAAEVPEDSSPEAVAGAGQDAPAVTGFATLPADDDLLVVEPADAGPAIAGPEPLAAAAASDEPQFDAFLPPPEERGQVEAPLWAAAGADADPETPPAAAAPAEPVVDLEPVRSAPLQPAPGSRERLELAIAYLDLGDADTARTLLEEVVVGGDSASREQAVELLARLD